MRILALDAAFGTSSAAVIVDGVETSGCRVDDPRGATSTLPGSVAALLDNTYRLDAVAVTVGPGSFTGVRAALSLAHGLALGNGLAVVAVTSVEALEAAVGPATREVWIAIDTKRGRVFLGISGTITALAIADLPMPDGPVEIAGDAACIVYTALSARGADVRLSGVQSIDAFHVGLVAAGRLAGWRPFLAAQPLYVEPPAARLQAALRPGPV